MNILFTIGTYFKWHTNTKAIPSFILQALLTIPGSCPNKHNHRNIQLEI